MIDDIVFEGVKFFELKMNDASGISYPVAIIFGTIGSTDIIQTESISII